MTEITELALIPDETALQVFTTDGAILPYLEKIKEAVSGHVPDLTTKRGRDAIASTAYKVAQSKTYLESVRKRLADEQKEIPRKIDATGRLIKETLDALRDEIRKPLTDWEAEQARIEREAKERAAKIDQELRSIDNAALLNFDADTATIQARIDQLESMTFTEEKFGDRVEEASERFNVAYDQLTKAKIKRQQYEADQAELAELRRLKESQQQAETAPEALPVEPEAMPEVYDGQPCAAEPVQQSQAPAITEREHRAKINACALEALIASVPSLTVEQAKEIITAIVRNSIPAVRISY